MDTIKAQRSVIQFSGTVSVDGYQLPDGEFRVGKVGAGLSLGYGKDWLGQISGKTLKALEDDGFSNEFLTVELDAVNGGGTTAQTMSMSDFNILVRYAASQGKRAALRILTKDGSIKEARRIEPEVKRVVNNNQAERKIQTNLVKQMRGAKTEIVTPAGKIDILTDTEVIEIKEWKRWKEAIGQVLCYGKYYPNHKKRIHFFGKVHDDFIQSIKSHCSEQGIIVTWESTD